MVSMSPSLLPANAPIASAGAHRAPRWLSLATTLLTAFAVLVSGSRARAETGTPLPQGYTSDIPAAPAPAQPSVPVQQVSDDEDVVEDESDYYEDNDPSALTDFREPLSPYGTWVEDPTYGTVWVPSSSVVGADFAPYQTSGHWAMDDNGDWLWVSDYDWGYIPFHYGRWVWIPGRGWAWIPGRRYAPAWVVWRVGAGGYVGWAPMPPTWYWSSGMAVNLWVTPYAAYCFVPSAYVFHHHVHTYVVRDPVVVRQVAAGTRPYHAARPSTGHAAATRRPYRPASPSLAEAGISKNSAPKARVTGNPRALALSRRSSMAVAHNKGATPRPAAHASPLRSSSPRRPTRIAPQQGVRATPRPSDRFSVSRPTRSPSRVLRTPPQAPAPRFSAPRSTPRFSTPRSSVPRSSTPRFSTPRSSTPRFSAPRSSTPRFSAPRSSTPRFSAPRSSTPRFSAPRSTFRAPSVSRPSSPSFSRPSGGSFRSSPRSFSGGRRR